MDLNDYITIAISVFGGVGLFLYGMHIMGAGLQKTAGTKMKELLAALTKNKFLGILVGAGVTAIIQSSSATTVMVVGFVNAGLMNLAQSVGIIMGANIGTTVTSWLVASVEWTKYFNMSYLAPVAVVIGTVMVLFIKKPKINQIGEIIVGFGILFVGMNTMSSGLKNLSGLPIFSDLFVNFGSNPLLGILVGAVVTMIIQSSSAAVAILQTLAATGLVPWNAAVYIIMGQNIGTCITAIISSIGSSKNAKRAACLHLLFNVAGTIIFSTVAVIFFTFINKSLGELIINRTEISIVHTVFNLASTIILYPFSNLLIFISQKLIKDNTHEEAESAIHLDERMLGTPAFAIENSHKEIIRLAKIVLENLQESASSMFDRNEEKIKSVVNREETVDTLEHSITQFLVKLSGKELSVSESNIVANYLHILIDIERVGDHCENLTEITQFMLEQNIEFAETEQNELSSLVELAISCYAHSLDSLENGASVSFRATAKEEDDADNIVKSLRGEHIKRLTSNEATITNGVAFLDALTNLERITDHSLNIAESSVNRIKA